MSLFTGPTWMALGDISPARFVIPSTTDFCVTQATGGTVEPAGISYEFTRYAPNTPFDTGFVASSGQHVQIYSEAQMCNIESGASFNSGVRLKPDGNGRGILATTGTYYGALALQGSNASGQRTKVQVLGGYLA